ncbi:MAG: tetratricopeptide repeat protein [Methanomicrobiales archaeon]|nr:tetratricopeptide repeat protein [Methanomicrobiales archaeon]
MNPSISFFLVLCIVCLFVGGVLAESMEKYFENEYFKKIAGESYIYTQIDTVSLHTEEFSTFDKSIQIDTKKADELRKKIPVGWSLDAGEADKKLLASYEKAIKKDNSNPKAWYNMANALKRLGRYTKALDAINISIQLDPEYAHAWSNKGQILKSLGKLQESNEAFAKASELEVQVSGIM